MSCEKPSKPLTMTQLEALCENIGHTYNSQAGGTQGSDREQQSPESPDLGRINLGDLRSNSR